MKEYAIDSFKYTKKDNNKERMKELYEIYKNDSYIKFEYAKILLKEKNFSEAEKVLKELLETNNYLYALVELGKLEEMKNNNEAAKEYFLDVLKYGDKKDKVIALHWLGRVEFHLKNYDKAKKYLNDIFYMGTKEDIIYAKLELGRFAFKLNDFQQAKNIFLKLTQNDNKLSKALGIQSLILLNIKTNNIKEALENIKFAIENNIYIERKYILYVSKILKVSIDHRSVSNLNYQKQQIVQYDPNYAIEHIINTHCNKNSEKDGEKFNDNINIYKLFGDIKKQLTNKNKLNIFTFNDVYLIPFPNIGSNGQNYLKVITLPNTKDILSMQPFYNNEKDLEYGHNYENDIYDEGFSRRK